MAQTNGRTALETCAQRYRLERMRRGEITRLTALNVQSRLRGFTDSVGDRAAAHDVSKLRRGDVERWLESVGHLAPATRRGYLSVVKGFTAWLVTNGYLVSDPSVGIARIRLPRYLPRQLRPDQVAQVLRKCPDSRARLMILLEVQLGLRCSEVSRLQFHDIFFGDRSMLVQGKGGHQRLLPVDDETWMALMDYLDDCPPSAGPLIRSYRKPNQALAADTISGMISRWMSTAGIKVRPHDGISAHALRHTACGDMLKAGAHVRDVQTALGHVSLTTTQRYMPLVVKDLREAMGGRRYRS